MFSNIHGGSIAVKYDDQAVNTDYFKMSTRPVLWNVYILSCEKIYLGSILTVNRISK